MDNRDQPTDGDETVERADTAGRNDETQKRTDESERKRRGDSGDPSIVDLAQQPIVAAWTTYLTLLLALVAVGYGLFGIFSDAIDEGVAETADGIAGFDAAVEAALSIPLTGTPYLAILLAVFVGAFLGWRLEYDRSTTYVTAGLATGVATVVFWTLAALFGTIPLAVSIDIGGLLVNALLAGITAGLVAAGGVWATRTRAPITLAVDEASAAAGGEEPRARRTDRRTAEARASGDARGTRGARDERVDPDADDTRDAQNERE
ncbi:ABC transporter permease [Natronorubrum tibetense]|uniref:Uncharacterized protein n=1 Tax=Natronorubrum tibetense GA33 TaxID=1114856 RepID=L9VG13_9EURY|nr:hypothetical protein [Natronorubrum tibetense]ELY35907.1 hypothetical protein C496_22299 [Natronorubrum tibetense GA33]